MREPGFIPGSLVPASEYFSRGFQSNFINENHLVFFCENEKKFSLLSQDRRPGI